jgi:hypothetical protein
MHQEEVGILNVQSGARIVNAVCLAVFKEKIDIAGT